MKNHGNLKKWNDDRGFGFIESPQHSDEIFVHISAFPRDGIRPKLGELISFDIQIDSKGKKRAIKVQRAGSRKPRNDKHKKSGSFFRSAFTMLVLVVIGYVGYNQLIQPQKVSINSEASGIETHQFRCDGRQHCSQMTSRAEAEFFVKNCPNTKMDGDHDGIPCENDSRF